MESDHLRKAMADLETLHEENAALTRELVVQKENHATVTNGFLVIQGLLGQFGRKAVRDAFIAGRFGVSNNTWPVLQSLDLLRRVVLPFPVPLGVRGEADDSAMAFITKLLSRDPGEPLDRTGSVLPHRQSFGGWRDYIRSLVNSGVWDDQIDSLAEVDLVEPAHTAPRNPSGLKFKIKGGNVESASEFCGRVGGGGAGQSGRCSGGASAVEPVIGRKKKGGKVPLVSSSSQSSSSGDSQPSDSSNSSSSSSDDEVVPQRKTHKKSKRSDVSLSDALRQLRLPKEAVSPGKFDIKTGTSLRRFLSSFERYFDCKFDGTDRDKALQLGYFLQGSIRNAYDAMNGSQTKYCKLKPKLLEWHKNERSSVRQKSFAEFQNAKMLPDDSLGIYCLRLEGLALKAFPKSSDERERQLRRKFRNTAPPFVLTKLDNAQSTLSMFGEKKLPWQRIRKLAEAEDRLIRQRREDGLGLPDSHGDPQEVWFSRPQVLGRGVSDVATSREYGSYPGRDCRGAKPNARIITGSAFRGGRGIANSPSKRTPPVCTWCGRKWHFESDCWLKLGLCLGCGDKNHKAEDCPKRMDQPGSALRCSVCGGPHLGRDCLGVEVSAKRTTASSLNS